MESDHSLDSRDFAVVLLVGQPCLNITLNQSTHKSLRQRIIMNYHMGSISKEEDRAYINRKLEGAGSHQAVFLWMCLRKMYCKYDMHSLSPA